MPRARPDKDSRRFFDEFVSAKPSRLRGLDVVRLDQAQAMITFSDGSNRLIAVRHTKFPNGGTKPIFKAL
jgi:hypothetical protein